jgi:hypothetical protein
MYSVQDILSWVPLTEAVEVQKTGIPKVLPPEFWSTTEQVSGNKARLIEFSGTRKTARVTPYGAPAKQAEKVSLSDRGIILLTSREEVAFRDELVKIFREWEDYKPQQMFAMRELAHQGEQFRQRFENLEIAAVTQTVANAGILYFDIDGNLLPTSSGAVLTVDQGVPSGNKDQLDVFGGGDIIDVTWSNTAANIAKQTFNLQAAAVKKTGYPLKYAIYGANIPGYMSANDSLKYFWARNQQYNQEYLEKNLVPEKFLDLIWVPANQAFYDDASDATQTIFPADGVTFTPEINKATYTLYRGSELVPNQFGPVSDTMAALKSMTEVFGRGRYAKLKDNPVEIIDIAFTHFLARLKVPASYFFADVAF